MSSPSTLAAPTLAPGGISSISNTSTSQLRPLTSDPSTRASVSTSHCQYILSTTFPLLLDAALFPIPHVTKALTLRSFLPSLPTMIVTQRSPQPLSSIPRTLPTLVRPSMSTSPPAQHNPTSVFHALGSYADRIKSPQNVPNPLIPNGNPLVTSRVISPSAAAGPAKTPSRSERPAESQDDGPWETVGRHRPREERRTGGTTQNWRDRPIKETNAEDSGRKPPEAKGGKKGTSSSAPRLPASEKVPATRAPVTPSAGIKTAWGVVTTSAALALRQEPQSTPSSTSSTSLQTPKTGITLQSQTEPSSPSPNSNTATNTSVSIASPNLSVETASSSTAPTSVALRGNDGEEEAGHRSPKIRWTSRWIRPYRSQLLHLR